MVMVPLGSSPVQAATSTVDNPIIFTVRGTVGGGGAVQYNIVIEDVYAGGGMTYQGFTITYPSEFTINYPVGLASTWTLYQNTGTEPKSLNAIIKTGTRTPAQLKADMQGIYFTLATTDVFPPDGSTVSLSATKEKVTFYQDEDGYVHYYKFVPTTSMTWLQAYNAAKSETMQDPRYPTDPTKKLNGYLATITSEEEQKQIYSAIATNCGWLGGTRMVHNSNKAKIQDDASISTTIGNFDTGTTNGPVWYWACGPEAWTDYNGSTGIYEYKEIGTPGATPLVFFNRVTHASNVNVDGAPLGVYHNFNNKFGFDHFFNSNGSYVGRAAASGAEPNNSSTEYVLQFAYTSGNKSLIATDPDTGIVTNYTNTRPDTWNDFALNSGTAVTGYYVEFGGYPTDPKAEDLLGSDVTTTSEVELVMPIIVQYRSTVQDETLGTYNQISGIGTTLDRIITYETHLPYTAERNQNPAAASIPGYTPYGYKFYGQPEDEDMLTLRGNGDVDGFHSTNTQRIVFLYKPDVYTLTFDANFAGWSSADVSPGSKSIYYDSPYGELATARRPGYILDGWTIDNTNLTMPITPTLRIPGTGDRTVYAKWTEKINYTVNYDLDGGTGDDTPLGSVAWTQSNLLPATNPTRSGYIFTGWNVLLNGTKQGVTKLDTYGSLAANDVETSITLQAQWMDENRILVIYHLNGADTPSSLPDADVAVSDYVNFPEPTRTGYTFAGWKLTNDGTGNTGDTYPSGTLTKQYQNLAGAGAKFITLEAQWTAKTYTVNYDKNDGSGSYGTPRTGVGWAQNGLIPPDIGNPTREHYIFMGWNTQPSGEGKTVYVGSTYAQLADLDTVSSVTLYAQWLEEKTYFVSYDTNGGTPAGIDDKTGVYFDTDNLLPDDPTPPVGYTFEGWSVSYNGTKAGVTSADTFGDLADDTNVGYIILKAQYSPKGNLTVTYNLNGHSLDYYPGQKPLNPPTDPYVVWTQSNLLPAADPVRSGWTFLGWNTAADGSGIAATNTDTFGVLAGGNDSLTNVTLYAQWQQIIPNTYTVIYNSNGGTPIDNVILNSVNAIVPDDAPANAPTGYRFSHWYVEDNGYGQGTTMSPNGTTVTYENLVYGSGESAAKFIKLKAHYIEIADFQVVYDLNYIGAPDGGIVHTESNVSWSQAGFVPYTYYRPGYNLIGWKAEINGVETHILSSTQYRVLAGGVDTVASVTLKAQWEEASFYVRYDLNGINIPSGTNVFDQRTVGFDDTDLIPNYELKRTGYTHVGWNVSENGSKMNIQSSDSFRLLANSGAAYITLQAQWVPKEYVVYYDPNGGDLSDASQGVSWWSVNLLPGTEPVRYGYTFDGWKLSKIENSALSDLEIESGHFITNSIKYSDLANIEGYDSGNITLQAQWTAKNYEVLYDLNGASTPTSIDPKTGVEWNDDGLLPAVPNPTRTGGYKFTGWKITFVGNNPIAGGMTASSSVTYGELAGVINGDAESSITLQAQWAMSDGYSVIYDLDGGTPSSAIPDLINCLDWADTELIPTGITITKAGFTFTGAWELIERDTVAVTPAVAVTSASSYAALAEATTVMEITLRPVYVEDADVTINYAQVTVGSDGETTQTASNGGTITKTSDIVAPATGLPSVTATANAGYTFEGWFDAEDTDFEDPIIETNTLVPPKDANGLNMAGSYVALFRENADVTIYYDQATVSSDSTTAQAASNGGTITKTSDIVAPATGLPSVEATAKAGYSFVGWYAASDTAFITPIVTTNIFTPAKVGDVNVAGSYVALFRENADVTITYAAVRGTVDSASESAAPATGTVFGATATADNDELFFGWYEATDTAFSNKLSGNLHFIPEKVDGVHVSGNYVAWFADETMLVAYWAINGTVSNGMETIDEVSGSTASANPGYNFDGWYAASDTTFSNRLSSDLTYVPFTDENGRASAGSYVARFLEDPDVTINYSAINGSVDNDTESVAPATETAAGSTASANPGYHFDGWYDVLDTTFSNPLSTNLTFAPETDDDDLNVAGSYVARFLEDPDVTINYSAINGSVDNDTEDVAPATGAPTGSKATANPGYYFDGWYDVLDTTFSNPLSTNLTFAPETDDDNLNVAGSYVARFLENPNIDITYTATAGGQVSLSSESVAPATGIVQGSTAKPNSGYRFDGWYDASDTTFSNKLSSELEFVPEPDSDGLNVTGNYVARFSKNPSPLTGDAYNLMPWVGVQIVAVLVVVIGFVKRKKFRKL